MLDQSLFATITKDAVWFITGCSTGLGRELAKQLLAQGSSVAMTARDPSDLLDVTDRAQVASAIAAAETRFGHIDVLVNNAGIGYFAAVEKGEDVEIRRMFDINLFGMGAVIQAVLPGKVVEGPNPPHQLLLGNAAYDGAIAGLSAQRANFGAWEQLSRGADFPVEAADRAA